MDISEQDYTQMAYSIKLYLSWFALEQLHSLQPLVHIVRVLSQQHTGGSSENKECSEVIQEDGVHQ